MNERQAQAEAVARVLLAMQERDIDEVLRAAHATGITPGAFGSRSELSRRTWMMSFLLNQPASVLDVLSMTLPSDGESAPEGAVAPTESGSPPAEPRSAPAELRPAPAELRSAAAGPRSAAAGPRSAAATITGRSRVDSQGPIFVVHGHDHELLHHAVRVLERGTGRDVVVLHEQVNAGRTILEKFEDHAESAAYAVVLLTGDDVGGASGAGTSHRRGRQNVIFELGFFFGLLGRRRVTVLMQPDVERPSDIDGLVYITFDPGGGWKHELLKEIGAAQIAVDYSRIP